MAEKSQAKMVFSGWLAAQSSGSTGSSRTAVDQSCPTWFETALRIDWPCCSVPTTHQFRHRGRPTPFDTITQGTTTLGPRPSARPRLRRHSADLLRSELHVPRLALIRKVGEASGRSAKRAAPDWRVARRPGAARQLFGRESPTHDNAVTYRTLDEKADGRPPHILLPDPVRQGSGDLGEGRGRGGRFWRRSRIECSQGCGGGCPVRTLPN